MMKHADLTTLTATFPLVQDLIALKETTWFNPTTTTWRRDCLTSA